MITPCRLFFLLALAGTASTSAQNDAAPPAAAVPAQPAMENWIATTDAQWQAAFKRDVTDPYQSEVGKMKLQYATAVEGAIAKASGASDLDGALALRHEQKRFKDSSEIPEQDDAAEVAAVKRLRAAVRAQLARLQKEREARARSLYAKYDAVLAQAQAQLTQRQRLDDALLVKKQREGVARSWLAGTGDATAVPVTTEVAEPLKPSTPRARAETPPVSSPAPAAPTTARQLEKALAKTTWGYSSRPDDPAPAVTVTIFPDETLTWSDRPDYHVPYKALDALSIQVRDHTWNFAAGLQSFTVHDSRDGPANRWGTRITPK